MKAVIFDWSGVVRDTVTNQIWIVNHIFKKYGVGKISTEEFRENWTQPPALFYQKYLPEDYNEEERSKLFQELQLNKNCPKATAFSEVVKLIHKCKKAGYFLAVVSSDFPETLLPEVKGFGLENVFNEVITNANDKLQSVQKLIKEHNLKPRDTFFVGDSNHEIDVARETGIKSIAVTWGFTSEQKLKAKNPDFVTRNSQELENVLFGHVTDSKHSYENRTYEIVPYSPNWIHQFKELEAKIKTLFRDAHIEHIGSTAVPGMSGKPCIDILVIVDDIHNVEKYIEGMQHLGFEYAGAYVTKDSRLFRLMQGTELVANIHFFPSGHPHIKEMLDVRNYLRSHKKEAKIYGDYKQELYLKYANDYASYRKYKDEYMTALGKRATDYSLRKIFLLILGVTALIFSRILFALFDDPEGPNLLIVTGMAFFLYSISLTAYLCTRLERTRFVLAVSIQVLIATCLYYCLS